MKKLIIFWVVAIIAIAGIGCGKKTKVEEKNQAANSGSAAFSATPKISDIFAKPENYLNKEVTVTGQFMGWKGAAGGPPVTRSDWVLKDETGAIYVVGPYPPGCIPPDTGIGTRIKVKGVVKINDVKQAYIQSKLSEKE